MQTIESIGFTDQDFDFLQQALEALEREKRDGSFMGTMMETLLTPTISEKNRKEFSNEVANIKAKKEVERRELSDKVLEVRYKIMQFKRHLIEVQKANESWGQEYRHNAGTVPIDTPSETPVSAE